MASADMSLPAVIKQEPIQQNTVAFGEPDAKPKEKEGLTPEQFERAVEFEESAKVGQNTANRTHINPNGMNTMCRRGTVKMVGRK